MSDGPPAREVPELRDERVRLRPWQVDDAPALVRAWHDPAILDGAVAPPDRSLEAAVKWIRGWDERRRRGLALDLVITSPTETDASPDRARQDRVLGEVGLVTLDSRRRTATIGWWVLEDARGTGVARAAVRLLTDWALAETFTAVWAEIAPRNAASIRVAESAGYRRAAAGNPQGPARGRAAPVWYVATSTVK